MGEAAISKNATTIDVTTPAAGYASGEVIQLTDGRAAQVVGLKALVEGDPAALKPDGQVTLAKTTSIVVLEGAPLYWDRSAGTCTPLKAVAGGDFFCGVAVKDAASADDTLVCDLNVEPQYIIDLLRDPTETAIVAAAGTAAVTMGPGYIKLAFSATAEVQKVDVLSLASIPVDPDGDVIPFIVEGRMTVSDNGDENSVDINVGIADATHGSDAGSIAESVFIHINGTALDIFAESDDGSTEVAETNTTIDYVVNTYFDFAFDCRDLTDIQIYINGALVLGSTTFVLNNSGIGPMKLLAHIEKGANDTPGEIRINKLTLRATDLAA